MRYVTARAIVSSLTLACAALLPGTGAAADPAVHVVDIDRFAFLSKSDSEPVGSPVVRMNAGDLIEWRNVDSLGLRHNVVQMAFIPADPAQVSVSDIQTEDVCGSMAPGQTCRCPSRNPNDPADALCRRSALQPGTYVYSCTIAEPDAAGMVSVDHSLLMRGVLVVE